MPRIPRSIDRRLEAARAGGGLRELALPFGADFSSNDYLGFAGDARLSERLRERVAGLPAGPAGSRLLRGQSEAHERSEKRLAGFSGQATALLFPSGYQANVGLFSSLLGADDLVYSDCLNHASIIDGIRLSGCEKRVYRHLDLSHLEELLIADRGTDRTADHGQARLRLIVTESLFSMDGDLARLEELATLAERFDAHLIVDEAHATGLFDGGRAVSAGLADRILASVHTGGKALGCAGAWVAGPESLRDYLINFSRAQIFSTAISPWLARALEAALENWEELGSGRIEALRAKIRLFRREAGLSPQDDLSPILPWIVGESSAAMTAARTLREQGFDVRAIRPPTVAEGTSRLRITIKFSNADSDITRLAAALRALGRPA